MRSWLPGIALVALFGTCACSAPTLSPTPNLYLRSDENPFADVPEAFRNNQVDVLYVTDRRREDADGKVAYGYGRSPSMAFGSAVVQFGDDSVTFDQLVEASRSKERDVDLEVSVKEIVEKGRFPATPLPYDPADDDSTSRVIHYDPVVLAERERVEEAFLDDLRARLALTPKKDVYVYVHGYNNDFDYAVSVISQIWHFLPRQGVPIAYSWPAGKGGLRGYFYDRESGEFTLFHLKEFLRMLTSCEEIHKVHLVAHSRGTDVLLSALRELLIELGGKDFDPGPNRKLGNVIVAAPDLDLEVVSQRVLAEEVVAKIDQLTVYMSETDSAIGLSTWLFVSQKRVGRVTAADFSGTSRARAESRHQRGVALIDAEIDSGLIGHSYFYSNRAVLSDLILILRDNCPPGAENGRPLASSGEQGFWLIDDDYLAPEVED